VLPDGVRLVLQLPAGRAISGQLTRDWVRPTVGGGKS
jgi:general secretion pathway protein J